MTDAFSGLAGAPSLHEFVVSVRKKFPSISGKLGAYTTELLATEPNYLNYAGHVIDEANRLCQTLGWTRDDLEDYYAEFVVDYLREQSQFLLTGSYSNANKDIGAITAEVYHDDAYMRSYMMGLFASYAIFPHHFRMYRFFVDSFEPSIPSNGACIEFGVGHGLFLSHLLKASPGRTGFGYDLSDEALKLAHGMMKIRNIEAGRIVLDNAEVTSLAMPKDKFDAMTAAGLLEHLSDPVAFLRRMREHLVPETGRAFFMVPVNTAHADHLFQLETIDQCRAIFADGGLELVAEEINATEDRPLEELYKAKIPIIYLGIYKRKA